MTAQQPIRRAPRRPRAGLAALASLAPLALAASLAAPPAQAASRYWTFIGGCASADWLGTTAGPNTQGRSTCWSDTFLGLSGQAPPTSGDDTFIVAPSATATLLVNFAAASRPAFVGFARDLTLYGNASFAAGLAMDRHNLSVRNLVLGAAGSGFLGRMDQSAGGLSVASELTVFGGDFNLSGGTVNAGAVQLRSQLAEAQFTQTGGSLVTGSVSLSGDSGRAASFSQLAGQVNSTSLNIGSLAGSTGAAVAIGNGARWDNSGATLVGVAGAGSLDIGSGARASTGTAVLGNVPGADGQVTVAGAGSTWAVAGLLTVGNAGKGSLVARDGGQVTASALVLNSAAPASGQAIVPAAQLQGAGTVVDVGNAVVVGRTRDALLEVTDGATLRGKFGVVGEASGLTGTVRLAGSGGASWESSTSLVVGSAGRGSVELGSANTLRSATAVLAQDPSGNGSVTLSGKDAAWVNTGALIVGDQGSASLAFSPSLGNTVRLDTGSAVLGQATSGSAFVQMAGGTWQNAGELRVGDAGSAFINMVSGSLVSTSASLAVAPGSAGKLMAISNTSSISLSGGLVVGSIGRGELWIGARSVLQTGSAVIGEKLYGTGTATITDNGSTWQNEGTLVVGQLGVATLTVAFNAGVTTGSMALGQYTVGDGTVNVQGSGRLGVNGTLDVGQLGRGRLNIASSGQVTVRDATNVAAGSQIVLDGGGLVSGVVALGDPARLDWRSGLLRVTGTTGVTLDGAALPTVLALQAGRQLQVDQALRLGPQSTLLLSGGTLRAGTLQLDGGVLASTAGGAHALDMAAIGLLTGQGQVAAAVRGGGGTNKIIATGSLTLGLAGLSDGFDFGGTLSASGQQVVLLDRDLAGLGTSTTLADNALLATVNGAYLAAGRALRGVGGASVQGRFVNDGDVGATNGALTFVDDVSGTGSFAGEVRFLAGYAPGNSTARVSFGGGRAAFGSHALLTLEINDTAPGTGFDQLLDIGTLAFDGTLALRFGSGFSAPAGTRLSLLDFDALEGGFGAGHVVVSGLDASLVDLSRLAVDGSITITAVPEPSAWALWLAGLGVVALRFTRPRRTPRSA